MNFDPFAQWGKVLEGWQKMADDASARTSAFWAELDKADTQRIERTTKAIDEVARLQKETVAYGAQLGAELRKISLEAMKKVSSFATPTAPSTPAA